MSEIERLKEAYARRTERGLHLLYDPFAPVNYMMEQEFERCLIRLIRHCGIQPVEYKNILDVGCGNGRILLALMKYGFNPAKMTAIDLLHERYRAAAKTIWLFREQLTGPAWSSGC